MLKENSHKCAGLCSLFNKCTGPVVKVHITGGRNQEEGKDWGKFFYCETAINVDRENGFKVEIKDETNIT